MIRPLFALLIRSIREDTRARLPPILRAVLVLVILLIIWANQRSFSFRAAPGREFFMMVMLLNAAFIGLMALSIFPSAIAEEKEDDTLTLLRMTNLSALSILLGKGASRLFAALMLIAVQIPFTLLGITLGGITPGQILFSYAVLGATTVFLCALGLAASVYCRTSMRAGFLTGIIGGVIFFLLPMLAIATTLHRMGPMGMTATNNLEQLCVWIVQANPVYALVMLFDSPRMTLYVTNQLWFMLGGAMFFFLLAWALFRPCCAGAEDTAGRPRKSRGGKTKPRCFSVGRPGLRPITWKDWNFTTGGRAGLLLRSVLALLIFLGCALFTFYIDPPYFSSNRSAAEISLRNWRQIAEMTITFACMAGALELLLVTARAFGSEYRRKTLSSLVAIPIKTGRIIRHKILGCLPCLIPWLILIIAGFIMHPRGLFTDLAEGIVHMDHDEIIVALYIIGQALLLLTVIVWFSLKLRRGGLPAAIAIIAGWNIFFAIVVEEVARGDEDGILAAGVVITVIALAYMAAAVHRRIEHAAAEDS